MKLSAITDDPDAGAVEVANIAYSTRDVRPGALFFCVPGLTVDGHDFAADAVRRGAVALVCDRALGMGVPEVIVSDVRQAMGEFAARFFGRPDQSLRVTGVTGTNGKTTVAYLLRQVLEGAGRQCALVGTVETVVGGTASPAVRTTPEAVDLQRGFREMLDAADTDCVMEVSSHALELRRVHGISFAVGIFTNLTQDHLDFHASMEDYFQAKRLLFPNCRHAVVNLDDPYGVRLADEFGGTTFSAHGAAADFSARDVKSNISGATFTCVTADSELPVRMLLPGSYNVANALAVIAAAAALGVDPAQAAATLATSAGAPGRFELIHAGQDFAVVVDYAHTPDSVDNVLRAARELTDGRVISVFGAGGDRDSTKRPLMGKAGALHSDLVIITSDNPRSEDPDEIIRRVADGATAAAADSGAQVVTQVDRRKAIEQAVSAARTGDVVVIAGKGHEQGQEFADGLKTPFDDVSVAREILEAAGK